MLLREADMICHCINLLKVNMYSALRGHEDWMLSQQTGNVPVTLAEGYN